MNPEPDTDVLDRNLRRLIRRWAESTSENQAEHSCRTFLERLKAPGAADLGTKRRPLFAETVALAASLLACAAVLWAIFSPRSTAENGRGGIASAPQESGRTPQGFFGSRESPVVQESEAEIEEKIRRLVPHLGSSSFEEQGRAAEEIKKIVPALGSKGLPFLQDEIARAKNPDVSEWLKKILKSLGGAPRVVGTPAGPHAGRLKGKANLVARGGGGKATEEAVLAALKWLSRHQNADGSWSAVDHSKNCGVAAPERYPGTCGASPGHADFDAGVTGLSLLAFLGAGHSHLSKDTHDEICFGDVVRKGLQWLMAHQDKEGCIGPRQALKHGYSHHICVLAMSEAYGLTGSNLFKEPAQKAVDFTVASQNPGKAWRYKVRSGDNDSSVTGWAVMALKSAELSGLTFPRAAYDGARAWFDEVTDEASGRVGYNRKGTGKVFTMGMNEHFSHHETLAAIGAMSRILIDRARKDPRVAKGCDLLLNDLPRWEDVEIDYYYWHHASLALFHYDGPGGPKWTAWNEKMKDALVRHQNMKAAECKNGSWDPVDRWSGEGGRVYATAINALTLEVYYRAAGAPGEEADKER
ncbi:MAG: terpene cyclase/mutase family protein [Planctomycetes bacterium]|nr:terpene cyclase/mutase family protein [Planctomycetota bacterium]